MADEEKLSFLDEKEPEEEVQVEAEQPEPEPEPEPEGEPEEEAAPPAAVQEHPQSIPVTALLDEREKRQAAIARAEQAERRYQELQRQIQQQQQPQPDWLEDPENAARAQQSAIEQRLENQYLNQSQFLAEEKYGAELVEAAGKFVLQHPEFRNEIMSHRSPWHKAVEVYQRQQAIADIGTDPTAYREKIRAELLAELQGQQPASQPSRPATPPPSMSRAPSAGRDSITPGNTFDRMFK